MNIILKRKNKYGCHKNGDDIIQSFYLYMCL